MKNILLQKRDHNFLGNWRRKISLIRFVKNSFQFPSRNIFPISAFSIPVLTMEELYYTNFESATAGEGAGEVSGVIIFNTIRWRRDGPRMVRGETPLSSHFPAECEAEYYF